MVELYTNLIKQGVWELDRVPLKWREAVRENLENQGYFNVSSDSSEIEDSFGV